MNLIKQFYGIKNKFALLAVNMNKKNFKKKKIQIVGVGGLILNKKGEILLTQRNEPDYKDWDGKWSIPGGHLEFGEELKKTLHREIKEELNVEVKILKETPFVASYVLNLESIIYHGILLCYPCQIIKGRPKRANKENKDFKWIRPEKINFQDCIPSTDTFVKEFLACKNSIKVKHSQ